MSWFNSSLFNMCRRRKKTNDLSTNNEDANSFTITVEETTPLIPNDYNELLVKLSQQKAKVNLIQYKSGLQESQDTINKLREYMDGLRDSEMEYRRYGSEIQNDLSSMYEQCKKVLEKVEIEKEKPKLENEILDKQLKLNIVL